MSDSKAESVANLFSELWERISEMERSLSDLESQLSEAEGSVDQAKSYASYAEDELNNVRSHYDDAASALDTAKDQLTELQDLVETLGDSSEEAESSPVTSALENDIRRWQGKVVPLLNHSNEEIAKHLEIGVFLVSCIRERHANKANAA